MSTDNLMRPPPLRKLSPYVDPKWQDHKFCCFLKVGICTKSHEVDYLKNVMAVDELSEMDKKEAAILLRRLADDFERE